MQNFDDICGYQSTTDFSTDMRPWLIFFLFANKPGRFWSIAFYDVVAHKTN